MKKNTSYHWVLIVVVVAAIFTSIAYYIYKSEREDIRRERFIYLDAIANLKVDQITKWRTERTSEATFFPSNENVIHSTILLSADKNHIQSKKFLDKTLRPIQQRHNYEDIILTDLNHNIIFSLDEKAGALDTLTINTIHHSILKDSIIFTDFYYCKTHSAIHLDIIAPIKDKNNLVGVMIFRIDPHKYFYPLVQKWPTPSKTAESVLIKDEGNLVRILNDVRFKKGFALSLTVPKLDSSYVIVKAVSNDRKILEGLDYRRIEVLASVKRIAGTDWLLVSKIDQEEIFEDIRYKAATITLLTLFAFLLFGVLIMFLYKNKQSHFYKDLFHKEKQLNEFQAQTKAITDTAQDAITMIDEKGNISFWNPAAENIFGYKSEEIIGKNLHKILSPESLENLHNKVFEKFKDNGIGKTVGNIIEFIATRKDGKQIPIELSLSKLKHDDVWHSVGIIRDISERKLAENKIWESEQSANQILNGMVDAVYVIAFNGRFLEINKAACDMLEYTSEEFKTLTPYEIDDSLATEQITALIKSIPVEKFQSFQTTHISKSGKRIPVQIASSLIYYKGEEAILCIARDITSWIKAQEAVYKSESLLNETQKLAKIGGWEWNFVNDKVWWSDELYEIFDVDPADFTPSVEANAKYVHPDDNEAYHNEVRRVMEEGVTLDYILRIISAKGKLKYCHSYAKLIKDSAGNNLMFIGTFMDITETKLAEIEISKGQERLRFALETSNIGAWDLDLIDHTAYRSLQHDKIFGYEKLLPEWTYEMFLEHVHPDDREMVDIKFKHAIQSRTDWNFECRIIRSDSVTRWILAAGRHTQGSDGKLSRMAGIVQDITERRNAESLIRDNEEKYRSLVEAFKDAIFINMNDKIIYVNPAMCSLMEADNEKILLDKSPFDIFHPDYHNIITGRIKEMLKKPSQVATIEEKIITVKGKVIDVEVSATSFVYQGEIAIHVVMRDITERKLAEQALVESEERFRSIVEGAPDAIFIQVDNKFNFANPQLCSLLGYKSQLEIKGKPVLDHIHPDFRNLVSERIKKLNIDQKPVIEIREIKFLKVDGSEVWVETKGEPILYDKNNAALVFVRDISERKNSEAALQRSEQKFRSLVKNSLVPMLIIDTETRNIIDTNRAAEKFYGWKKEELTKKKIDDINLLSREELVRKMKRAVSREQIHFEFEHRTANGVIKDVDVFTSKIEIDDKSYLFSIIHDITDRKKIEKEIELHRNNLEEMIKQRTGELNDANKQLVVEIQNKIEAETKLQDALYKEKELSELKTRFISTASHEFRTPLTTILSSAELIQRYGKNWEESKYAVHLDRIKSSVEYLTELMNDVLTVSRIEAKKIVFNPELLDIQKLALSIISEQQQQADLNHILEFSFNGEGSQFYGDQKQIKIILQNLITNAIKYSPPATKVLINIFNDPKELTISVKDQGYGMTDEEIEHIFEPFYRSVRTESIQGTGLGLPILKSAVEMHSGKISIESELDKGTNFLIKLPVIKYEKDFNN